MNQIAKAYQARRAEDARARQLAQDVLTPAPKGGRAEGAEQPGPAGLGGSARKMRVVKKNDFVVSVEQALERVLAEHLGGSGSLSRAIRADMRFEILGMLRRQGRKVRGVTKEQFLEQLSKSHDRLVRERAAAMQELDGLKGRVDDLRSSSGKVLGLEERLKELYDSSKINASTSVEHQILAFAQKAVSQELSRAGAVADNRADVEVLERRIAKLTSSMGKMEGILQKLAKMKNVDLGVASLFRTVQGLSDLDGLFDMKQEMLRDIFEANQGLRDVIAS